MEQNLCFDSEKYLELQKKEINARLKKFDNKLYMEFGGKLFDDLHASRVLPGFDKGIQIKILDAFKDKCEILLTISAQDIENDKIRGDSGITYQTEVLRLMSVFRKRGLLVSGVIITLFAGQQAALDFKNKLEGMGEKVYVHYYTSGYPSMVDKVVSDEGYGKNDFVPTTKPLVVITAPGPGSGKLASCLSQLYHENKRGVKAGYAKFEKFPVWNLPLKHPVNLAYEAATADLKDANLIDSYHYDAYGKIAVSYNRDMNAFPVLKRILDKIYGKEIYKSPTDMGINSIASCITDNNLARISGEQEIISRYLRAKADVKIGKGTTQTAERIRHIMNELGLTSADRTCVKFAEEKQMQCGEPSFAIELSSGEVVCGRRTNLLSATSSAVLNALKTLAGIDDKIELLPHEVLQPVLELKNTIIKSENKRLSLRDVLIVLSISAQSTPISNVAMGKLLELNGCKAHSTHILNSHAVEVIKSLGINLTCGTGLENTNIFEE